MLAPEAGGALPGLVQAPEFIGRPQETEKSRGMNMVERIPAKAKEMFKTKPGSKDRHALC